MAGKLGPLLRGKAARFRFRALIAVVLLIALTGIAVCNAELSNDEPIAVVTVDSVQTLLSSSADNENERSGSCDTLERTTVEASSQTLSAQNAAGMPPEGANISRIEVAGERTMRVSTACSRAVQPTGVLQI